MALDPNINRIKFLRSTTAGAVPAASLLQDGELAINLVDRTIYSKNGANVVELGFGKGGSVKGNVAVTGTISATSTITAPTFSGALSGNAATATKLQTARTISLTGSATGSISFDGTSNQSISVNVNKLDALATYARSNDDSPTKWAQGVQSVFVSSTQGWPMPYGGVITARPHSNGGGALQILTAYGSGSTVGNGEIKIRTGDYSGTGNDVWTSWKTLVHSENVGTYAPTLTGSGASGTWAISISGNAGSATSAAKWTTARTLTIGDSGKSVDGSGNVSWSRSDMGVPRMTTLTSVGIDNAESCIGYITNPLLGAPDGALYSHVYSDIWKHQIQGDYRTGQIAVRGKNNGTWQAWRTVLDSGNYNDYSPSKTGTGASGTWGIAITGNAATATRLQTACTIALTGAVTGTATSFNGSANISIATTAIDGSKITTGTIPAARIPTLNQNTTGASGLLTNLGQANALTKITEVPPRGLTLVEAYDNGYPASYGNVLRLGGIGQGEIFVGWPGSDTGSAPSYIRGKRDNTSTAQWSPWREIVFVDALSGYNVGSANMATKLATARKINGVAFDGSADITIADSTKLPLTGGTINGSLNVSDTITITGVGDHANAFKKLIQAATTTDGGYLAVGNNGADRGYVEIGTIDDADAEIYATQRNLAGNGVIRRAKLLDSGGNTSFPGTVTAPTFIGNLSGNAATATKLATNRLFSFTGDVMGSMGFDGSADTSASLILANSGVTAGTYKSVTVDEKGRVTRGTDVVTGLVTSTTAAGTTNAATTNANTYLNIVEHVGALPSSVGASSQITGAGTVTVASDTSGKITITGSNTITGNAATATALQTARTIGGVSFDGSANINLPGVNTTGNQSTTGNAGSATKLQTARTIGGVPFDGSANINLPGVNTTGNQSTTGNAATATALQTASGDAPSYSARAWVNFNGTGTVAIRASGNVSSITDNGVGNYTVNFATAMNTVNYTTSLASYYGTTGASRQSMLKHNGQTVSSVNVVNVFIPTSNGASLHDTDFAHVAVFS